MSYLGRSVDAISNIETLDNITFDGSSSYTLQKGGSNFVPSSANAILISIDGVVNAGNFTVSSSTIDFGVAVSSSSVCNFIIHLGVGLITAPSDSSVTTSKLASGAVNNSKIASDAAIATTKLGTGAVLQVVQGVKTAYTSTTSTSFSATGLKATITPSSTSSKVLVQVSLNGVDASGNTNRNASFKLYKGGSFLDWIIDGYGFSSSIRLGTVAYTKLVSPSTTSATEFEVFFAEQGGSGLGVGFNNFPSSNNTSTSTITLMEIAG